MKNYKISIVAILTGIFVVVMSINEIHRLNGVIFFDYCIEQDFQSMAQLLSCQRIDIGQGGWRAAQIGGLGLFLLGVVRWLWRRSKRQCADCQEIVKKSSTVCRHCGSRS